MHLLGVRCGDVCMYRHEGKTFVAPYLNLKRVFHVGAGVFATWFGLLDRYATWTRLDTQSEGRWVVLEIWQDDLLGTRQAFTRALLLLLSSSSSLFLIVGAIMPVVG